MTDHYFSPADFDAPLREISVHLAGEERSLVTAPGVFSGDRLDAGTEVLLAATPEPPLEGNILDLGAGWGPISVSLALRAPGSTVWAVDVNPRGLDLVRRNAERSSLSNIRTALPEDVPALQFAGIWSNPPIRVGKVVLHEMLLHWMPMLAPGASAWLVVQKHLGSDSLERWLNEQPGLAASRYTSKRNYRIIQVRTSAI